MRNATSRSAVILALILLHSLMLSSPALAQDDILIVVSLSGEGGPHITENPAYLRGPSAPAGATGVQWFVTGEEGHTYVIAFESGSPFSDNLFQAPNETDSPAAPVKPTVNSGEYTYNVYDRNDLQKVIVTGKLIIDSSPPRCTEGVRDGDTVRPTISFSILDNAGLLPPIYVEYCTNAEIKIKGVAQKVCSSPISTEIAGFEAGETTVPASIRKIFEGPTIVRLRIFDQALNSVVCDPVLVRAIRSTGKPVTETFSEIPQEERAITITNGSPGLTHVEILVNGWKLHVGSLRDGEERTFDISTALSPGNQNIVIIKATGKPGGSALIMIWEGPGGSD